MDAPAPSARWRLSLILPAFNEEAGIGPAIREADRALAALCDDYEILVVDDGSTDATAVAVAEAAAEAPRVRLLRHDCNRGYGAALRAGFLEARCEHVAFTDADCQFHLEDLGRLLPLTTDAPIAVGYRVDRQDAWTRRVLSAGFNLFARLLLGTRVRDCDCALKVFRREVLADLLPETEGFFVNAEMLAKARQHGYAVAEAGVRHRPRLHGSSKVSLGQVPRVLSTLLPFWWSRVLFPGLATPGHAKTPGADASRSALPALALLLLVAGLLFFTKLRAPLLEPQEPRYAEIPRQMLAEGRWVVPVLHGEPYLDKPPMLYWLVMASYTLFGVSDWAARLVPGCAGVLTVLVTYLWGRRIAGERAGLCGALILCLSPEFVYRERMLTFDGVLCLWVAAALATAHTALTGARLRWRWWLLSAAACGLGLLTKGPVALVLVAGPVLAYSFLDRRCPLLTWRGWSAYLGSACLVALPWYAAMAAARPDFAGSFFWTHNVMRFVRPFDHAEPFWFYLPGLLLGLLPWTLLLPGLARFLGRRETTERPAALGFFLLASAWTVFFFSAAGCKRSVYLLPAFPPLALALGIYLDGLLPRAAPAWVALWGGASRLAGGATALVLLLAAAVGGAASAKEMVRPVGALVFAGAAAVGIALILRARRQVAWGVCMATTFGVLYLAVRDLQPAYNRQFALRGDLRANAALLGDRPRVACYPQRWDSVSFYLPGADVKVYRAGERDRLLADLRAQPRTLLLVKSGRHLTELLADLPQSLEFVSTGRAGAVTVGAVQRRGGAVIEALAAAPPGQRSLSLPGALRRNPVR